MDLSDGHVTAAAKKLFSHDESTDDVEAEDAKQATSNETSLEMIKLSLTSSSAASEDRVVQTEVTNDNNGDVTANPSTLSDRTLGPELPSLPTDQCDDSEPVSLSQIQLQDMSVTES
jgi:hypothetical protein